MEVRAPQDRWTVSLVSDVANLLHDVGQHGFDEYEAVASAYMPSDLSKQELSFAVASLRNTFHKTRQRSTSSSLESFVRAIVASSAVFASRAQIPTPTDGMLCPVDANDSMCNDLQIQMGNLWKQLKDLSDEEESILASMRTVQPSLFIDADSLARVKSIMQDAREAESFLKDCTEHIECLKQQELLSASRKQADGKIAESGLQEVEVGKIEHWLKVGEAQAGMALPAWPYLQAMACCLETCGCGVA